jgi:osmotically-inducible protein OsmY
MVFISRSPFRSGAVPSAFAGLVLLAASIGISGCAGPLISVAASEGTSAAGDRRSLGERIDDSVIGLKINESWLNTDVRLLEQLDQTVRNGEVLLTGQTNDPELRLKAVQTTWKVAGVSRVINEINLADSVPSIGNFARDAWISAQLRAILLADANVQAFSFSVDTVAGVVYIMGIANDVAELTRVLSLARTIAYVREVRSFVTVLQTEAPPKPAS